MKKVFLVLVAFSVVFVLSSCKSITGGNGYGRADFFSEISGTESEYVIDGISGTSTFLFGKTKKDSGFFVYRDFSYIYDRQFRNVYFVLSWGPSWLIRISNRFKMVLGAGLSFGYGGPDSILVGYEGLIEGRYFFSKHGFIGLKGTVAISPWKKADTFEPYIKFRGVNVSLTVGREYD